MQPLEVTWGPPVGAVDSAAWDALTGADDPFVEHAFLAGLERSGAVGSHASGWLPRPILVRDQGVLVGALPLYEKHDSYGEFIFDWAWAHAAARAGVPYYPKMVAAVPFTPATGPRCLVHPGAPRPQVLDALVRGARAAADACGASGLHVLFCGPGELEELGARGLQRRRSFQFHWHRQPHWHKFDDFLADLRAPARKQVRRERAIAAAHGLRLSMCRGDALGAREWAALYRFYRSTVAEKGAHAYLPESFFALLRGAAAPRVVAALAHDGDEPVAAALFLQRGRHLFGRYWGAAVHLDALHFELCYYQPIAWALGAGIERFEAGAQGEHKLKRGLVPSRCHSAHWLRHPGLAAAVADFLPREAAAVEADIEACQAHSPYRRPDADAPTQPRAPG